MSHTPSSPLAAPTPRTYLPPSCMPPTASSPPQQLVWLVFGATGHLGRSICRVALKRGDLVTAVGNRSVPGEEASMEGWHKNCQGLVCDVRVASTVKEVFEKSLECWGRVDRVVNCTGYGIIGACEDQDTHEIRAQFTTNTLGTLHILQSTLPYLRSRPGGGGHYLLFSSTAGTLGIPGLGPYCATKWAIEGLAESLMYEVEPLGIKVTIVIPGVSRRDEPDEALHGPAPMWGHFLLKPPEDAYRATSSPAQHATRMIDWLKYREPTSAVRCAEIVWELAHCVHPPLRLFIGNHAVEAIRDRLRSTIEEIEDWKHLNYANRDEDGDGNMGEGAE
ncbi:uncharacterized protein H6S33_012377 [Morchella sextelata]|uniref:uncharacterized protein n=1 Tax=Morchella sextelata TaxID=1174677 RepID=UPI001D03F6FC|nr:uncharacterized protein H6S33_012377 [Morchella sextelata]KAH0609831.1 hypothetical protein H6S33_012377 [Morchella sextelata]